MLEVFRAEGFTPPGANDFNLPALFGWVTKPMLLVVISVVLIAGYFLVTASRLRIVPSRAQFAAEYVYEFSRDRIARDQIGSADFRPYVPLLLSLFTFVLVNNIFGLIPLVQFPTMARMGFPVALAVFVVFPLYHFVGIRRHGLRKYLRNQLAPPGVPKPALLLVTPIEAFLRFFMDPITLAIRVFAAMFAGHLLLLAFAVGGQYLLLHAAAGLKPVSVVSFAFAVAVVFLEALVQVVQAYIFAALAAGYLGRALAEEH